MTELLKKEVKTKVDNFPQQAKNLSVATKEEYESAATFLKDIKVLRKQVKETFDPIVKKASDAHREAVRQRKIHEEPLETAERLIKNKMGYYVQEEERKQREERRRLEEEERKRAIEQQKREAEERKQREEQTINDAAELEAAGDTEAAEILLEDMEMEVPKEMETVRPIQQEKTTVQGISTKKSWDYEIINPAMINKSFYILDEKKIRKVVTSMGKDAEGMVGGIKVFQKTSIAARV